VKSQVEVYRAKAKEYARLTILTKSLRESRRYRKLAEMYWALALGEQQERVQASKEIGNLAGDERAAHPLVWSASSHTCVSVFV
jgi:hypothetical protein